MTIVAKYHYTYNSVPGGGGAVRFVGIVRYTHGSLHERCDDRRGVFDPEQHGA